MKEIPVIIIGAGGVGRALLSQIVDGRENCAKRNEMRFKVLAVADSKKFMHSGDGLTDEQLLSIVNAKKSGKAIGEDRPDFGVMLERTKEAGVEKGILVDVTAQDGMEPVLDQALEMGWGVVLANKKAFAGKWADSQRFFHHARVRHESTVGGGQPVIATMRYLADSNDAVSHIEGQLSGTLGYICQRLDEGAELSLAIAEAKAKGFTEPDPREDLGGMDVQRKALIMARLAGWELEPEDIEVESLYDASLAHLSVPEFMASAVALDPAMKERVYEAGKEGMVLRYIAEVSKEGGKVGLKPMAKESALANLKYIAIRTEHYDDEALMLCGKGAGVGMTAAGVIGDMIGLGREMH